MNLSKQQIASFPATYSPNTVSSQSPDGSSPGRATYERAYVRTLFNRIAHRYDLLNHFLSSGLDILWRKQAIALLQQHHPRTILDVATGTGDFAIEAARLQPDRIIGLDIAAEMLKLAKKKIDRKKLNDMIRFEEGAAEDLPFPSGSFDAVTVAFGVRNFSNLEQGLAEICRVLRPGGAAIVLEFSRPTSAFVRAIYDFYSQRILPRLGGWISSHREAYEYLPRTIKDFPDGNDFCSIMRSSGFGDVRNVPLTLGVVTIYHGIKNPQGA